MAVTWQVIDQVLISDKIRDYFGRRGLIQPDAQDAATFCVEEAVELLDMIIRQKNYVRNHDRLDTSGKEAAQTLMMLVITCNLLGIDLDSEFIHLMSKEVTNEQ
jgi:NTP pyrophosphatase (non-canonical NTP hydrolase)